MPNHPDMSNCPFCYANRKGRSNYKDHWGFRPQRLWEAKTVGKFTEMVPVEIQGEGAGDADDGLLSSMFPAITEYLTESRRCDDGVMRTSTLLLIADQGAWKLCLNDRPKQRSLWASGTSLEGAMRALEANLAGGGTGWRKSDQGPQKGKGRRT